jgi:hypothetical protein
MPLFAILALALTPAAGGGTDTTPLPEWMQGTWIRWRDGRWVEESWFVRGSRMLGVARAGEWDVADMRDTLVIERTGRNALVLIAEPGGTAAAQFAMVAQDTTSIEFANPWHRFPQRITYRRRGGALNVEMSMLDGTRSINWTYQAKGPYSQQ